MDYEKKYKEALSFLKDLKSYMSDYCIEKLEGFFPEIIESEDERIKREILELVSISGNGNQFEEIKNWLGKQGKQKPEEWCFPYNVNETVDKLMAIAECLEMDEDFLYNGYTGTECVKFLRDLARKQVECKPTDEIKPKFKVGDWITNDEYTWKVTDIKPLDYILQSQAGSVVSDDISYVDEHFHLWTIQDAKDGDVLAYYNGITEIIMMFKSWFVEKRTAYTHFHVFDNIYRVNDSCICGNGAHPATKEQRDFLFQKMKENGYEWDAEKKELNKIEKQGEQNPTDMVEPKFKVGDWIINNDKRIAFPTQILKIEEYGYVTSWGYTSFDKVKTDYHLWTIEDTKDGDVLAAHECLVLFKKIDGLNIRCYCTYHFMNNQSFYVDTLQNKDAFYPATKEQCDLLFQKMKEAGYEWDAENKKLNKIEQESTWNEKIKGLTELETYIFSLVPDRSLDAIKVDTKNIRYIINKEQNPTWNEEDE